MACFGQAVFLTGLVCANALAVRNSNGNSSAIFENNAARIRLT
jgi:hypothetical protein